LAADPGPGNGKGQAQAKYYDVNSNMLLMERVELRSGATATQVLFENWTSVTGNRIPRTIRRLENGQEVFRLVVTSAVFEPARSDTFFCAPGRN
jgi:hypothetical protein